MSDDRKDVTEIACLALGSNLGDRDAIMRSAIAALRSTPGIEVLAVSPISETEPLGLAGQGRYLNAAVKLKTSISARRLLDACMSIERQHGRDRSKAEKWGPRTLDIDLLLYGSRIIDEPGLRVPHPHMAERMFVLEPLSKIAGEIVHPIFNTQVNALLSRRQTTQTAE